jgi:serine/threonine protein kinase/tetratricopeptide (TPR) repeat protein
MTGQTILHYKVGAKLGSGGMGEVYRAEDTRLGRAVALKFLSASDVSDQEKRRRLLQEARAASVLQSPHIAVTYDIVEHDPWMFIVMEYVEGQLLSRRLERGPLAIPEAVDFGAQTAEALDEAHSHGIIHRDIKPSNLMITERGTVKVLDFGIAKVVRHGGVPAPSDPTRTIADVTSPGVILGTVSYMSPEQAMGRALDPRTDIFSLGVLLYQMATGRLPFVGSNPIEVIDRILHHEASAPAELNGRVPDALSAIILRAMEKEPARRYQAAREIRDDLRQLGRDLEGGEEPAPPGVYAQEPAAPSSSLRLRGATGSIPRTDNTVAVMTFSNITKEPADDWIGSGIAETVTADIQSVHGLTVIGRARVFEVLKSMTSTDLNVLDERAAMDLGRRLRASWIVGGGYQRLGPAIRITAHFVDVKTGALVKTVKVDGQIGDIFQLQDKIVFELTQGLNVKLRSTEMAAIERKETQSVEAYEAYSRGMINLRSGTRESLDRAIYLFERALEHDPQYASAWAGLGAAYTLKGQFLGYRELANKAMECARRAVELNPRLSTAHAWLGSALAMLGRVDEAVESIQEAVRLDPTNSIAHSTLGRVLWVGKGMLEEGIASLERCVALNPEAGYAHLQLGFVRALMGDLDRAEAACRKAIDFQERYISGSEGLQIVGGHTRLGYVHYLRGRHDDAIEEYEREIAFLERSDHALKERSLIEVHQKLGAAWLRRGNGAEAERHFAVALKAYDARVAKGAEDPFTKYYVACVHALRGDADRAIRLLGESLAPPLQAFNSLRARTDPDLAGLREDPAFRRLVGDA